MDAHLSGPHLTMLANALTLSRLAIAAGFVIGVAIASGGPGLTTGWTILLIAIALAEEATDIFDGVIARRMGTASPIGGILDPLCDSLSRLAMYFALALCGLVTIAVPLVMAGRDIVVAYVRTFSAMTGGKTSARVSGKIKAILQGAGAPLLVLVASEGVALTATALQRWQASVATVVIAVTVSSLIDYLVAAASAFRSGK